MLSVASPCFSTKATIGAAWGLVASAPIAMTWTSDLPAQDKVKTATEWCRYVFAMMFGLGAAAVGYLFRTGKKKGG